MCLRWSWDHFAVWRRTINTSRFPSKPPSLFPCLIIYPNLTRSEQLNGKMVFQLPQFIHTAMLPRAPLRRELITSINMTSNPARNYLFVQFYPFGVRSGQKKSVWTFLLSGIPWWCRIAARGTIAATQPGVKRGQSCALSKLFTLKTHISLFRRVLKLFT